MISIVIPLYNKAHTIERTLGSVLNQTFKDFEIVIVNDGSTDNGVEVIKNFTKDPRIRIVNQENQGVSAARNRGVAEAKYEYLAFLDGDDEWLFLYLQAVVDAIKKYPDAGMICTALMVMGKNVCSFRIAEKYKNKSLKINYFENPHMFGHTSSNVIKKTVFQQTQEFPVGMKENEDYACFFSIALITNVIYIGIPLSIYHGDVIGQATSSINNNERVKHIVNRFNLCYEKWVDTGKKNQLFLTFMKYELRTTILSRLKSKNR